MNSKWIDSFKKVADCGSLTSAANELYISPQALMQQINLLEAEIGVSLFHRSPRGMELTIAGKEFYRGTEQLEQIFKNTMNRCKLADKAQSSIRIPMMSTIVRPKFMEKVCQEYRHRNKDHLEIHFIPDTNFSLRMEQLSQMTYDLTEYFTLDEQVPEGIHFESMYPQKTWCVFQKENPLSQKEVLCPEDFKNQKILTQGSEIRLSRYLQIYLETHMISVEFERVSDDLYPILAGIENGGIYLANKDIAKEMSDYCSLPLDFDTHVYYGFACRENMKDTYQDIFDIAHEMCKDMDHE